MTAEEDWDRLTMKTKGELKQLLERMGIEVVLRPDTKLGELADQIVAIRKASGKYHPP